MKQNTGLLLKGERELLTGNAVNDAEKDEAFKASFAPVFIKHINCDQIVKHN